MPVFPLVITVDVFLHCVFKFILSEVMVLCDELFFLKQSRL